MNKTSNKKRFSISVFLLLLINTGAFLLLIMAYASFYLEPALFPWLPFAGLAYPYLLLANILFILTWLLYRPKYALLSLFFILIGWNHTGRLLQVGNGNAEPVAANDISILSFNIQNFIKFNTSSTKYLTDFENEEKIHAFVIEQKADIVCLQEVLNDRKDHGNFIQNFGKKIDCPNSVWRNYYQTSREKVDAIAIFTRYQILKSGYLDYDDKTIAIYADILVGNDTVRVYNLHLASIHFKKEDIDFISEITETQEQEKLKSGTKNIVLKLKQAFIKRGKQVGIISRHMEHSTLPLIICGDFNDTPTSYTYRKIGSDRQDAFVIKGHGLGTTYAGEIMPAFRIDYMFFDDLFHIKEFTIHDNISLSDHYPLSSRVKLKNNQPDED
ncbi:MAG: endonuclease/exonuclease/phosphatase family protein [Bacteroidales bacterium]|nr:endonuclease/exonuclease/phosphatase family protein [Bacteroidales bacterium]